MKINELSQLTGINAETIRSWRNKGLLHPVQLDNGYYDYGTEDYVSLLYVKKMRSISLSSTDIEYIINSGTTDQQLAALDRETSTIADEIADLQEQLRFLEFEKRHIKESFSTSEANVLKFQSIDDKFDFYNLLADRPLLSMDARMSLYRMSTPTLYISREVLNGNCSDRLIPLEVGVGTYRYILDQNHIPIPSHARKVPNGICLSEVVRLSTLTEINLIQLKPMMDYAKKLKMPFISGTTGYLIRIHMEDGVPVYWFRIRACIEENTTVDYGAR